jgi:hypothetical protein
MRAGPDRTAAVLDRRDCLAARRRCELQHTGGAATPRSTVTAAPGNQLGGSVPSRQPAPNVQRVHTSTAGGLSPIHGVETTTIPFATTTKTPKGHTSPRTHRGSPRSAPGSRSIEAAPPPLWCRSTCGCPALLRQTWLRRRGQTLPAMPPPATLAARLRGSRATGRQHAAGNRASVCVWDTCSCRCTGVSPLTKHARAKHARTSAPHLCRAHSQRRQTAPARRRGCAAAGATPASGCCGSRSPSQHPQARG